MDRDAALRLRDTMNSAGWPDMVTLLDGMISYEQEAVMDLYEQTYQDADVDDLQAEFDRLQPKAETGEQFAHLCWLSQRINELAAVAILA